MVARWSLAHRHPVSCELQVLNGRRPELPTSVEDATEVAKGDGPCGPPGDDDVGCPAPESALALAPGAGLAQVPASLHALPHSAHQHHPRLLAAEGAPPPVRRPGTRRAEHADARVWECDEHGVRRG
jgi:hypothetical protein